MLFKNRGKEMALRRSKLSQEAVAVPQEQWLSVDASMSGTLSFKDPVNLRINGRFEGTLETKGNLSIGEDADVKATIRGERISVSGKVQGTLKASERVELKSTAFVCGKVTSPRVIMEDGSVLQGLLEMGKGTDSKTKWMDSEELSRYLEVDVATVEKWAQEGRLPATKNGSQWQFERVKIEDWLAHERVG